MKKKKKTNACVVVIRYKCVSPCHKSMQYEGWSGKGGKYLTMAGFINSCSNRLATLGLWLREQRKDHEYFLEQGDFRCQTGPLIARRSVGEGGRAVRCTSTVQHEGLVDTSESVNFMVGSLETDFELVLDSLEVLDVAGR